MEDRPDRIAIIDAIQSASNNELQALSEIKEAITGANIPLVGSADTGRVSRRLARAPRKEVVSDTSPVKFTESPYVARGRYMKKGRPPLIADNADPLRQRSRKKVNVTTTGESTARLTRKQGKDGGEQKLNITVTAVPDASQLVPQKRAEALADAGSEQAGRDSKGRFTSRDKNEALATTKENRAEAKARADQQNGFFRKLGSIIGMDGKSSGGSDDALTDAVGVGMGGPMWMAARGAFDIANDAREKATTLTKWLTKNGDNKDGKLRKEPKPIQDNQQPLTYPPVEAKRIEPPALGKSRSADAFSSQVETKSEMEVEKQTKILASNDERVIDGLEDVTDEVIKLRKAIKADGGFSLKDLLPGGRNRWGGRRNRRGSRQTSYSKNKGSLFSRVKTGIAAVGSKVAGGALAATGAITGTAAVLKKKPATASPDSVKQPVTDSVAKTSKDTPSVKQAAHTSSEAAEKTTAKSTESVAEKTTQKSIAKGAESTSLKIAGKGMESAGMRAAEQGALKLGGKAALSMGARAVPIVGTVGMAAYDAIDGYNDDEAQQQAFNLKEGEEATTQQKSSYAAANMVDMGGLLTGGLGLIGQGISALGMTSTGETLQSITTDAIARGINGTIDSGKDLARSVVSSFNSSDTSAKSVKTAVEDGTKKTVLAIDLLGQSLQGGRFGEDGVGKYGNVLSDFEAPQDNHISTDLNIGGNNAKNRNFRNNNLGNLVFAGQTGASLEEANAKGERRFARFNTPEEGIRGLANQVSSYYNGTSKAAGYQKLQSVSSIIAKWAPPNENNTNQYIKNVCDYLGVSPSEKIDATDPEVMTRLVRAIATKEGGNPAVNDDFIKNALGSFNADTGRWEGQFSDQSLAKLNEAQRANGGAEIARDSQYSAGNRVKYASGSAPVLLANQTGKPEPLGIESGEVEQHAQMARRPAKAALDAAKAVHNKPQPHVPSPAAPSTPSAAASVTAPKPSPAKTAPVTPLSKEKYLAAAAGGLGIQAMNDLGLPDGSTPTGGENSGVADAPGSLTGLMGDMFTSSLKLGTQFMTTDSAEGLTAAAAQAKEMDQAMTAKIQSVTGKRLGFSQASQIAAISSGTSRRPATPGTGGGISPRQSGVVDLLDSEKPKKGVPVNDRGIPVYDNGYRIVGEGEGKGIMGSLMDSSLTGLKQLGSAVLPVAGKNVSRVIGGIDGTGILNDLMNQATGGNADINRAVSPIIEKAGGWLNGGIQDASGTINNAFNSANNAIFNTEAKQEPFMAMPQTLNSVVDLARSGIRSPITADTVATNPEVIKAIDGVYSVLKDLLKVNKENQKGEPDKVVNTAQPQPRERASTAINDPSLDALLRD